MTSLAALRRRAPDVFRLDSGVSMVEFPGKSAISHLAINRCGRHLIAKTQAFRIYPSRGSPHLQVPLSE